MKPMNALRKDIERLAQEAASADPARAVDLDAELRSQIKQLNSLKDTLDKVIQTAMGNSDELSGDTFKAKLSVSTPWVLDTKRIKEDMPEDWVQKYSQVTERRSLRFSAK